MSAFSRLAARPGLHIALLLLLPILVYSNTLQNSLHLDDFYFVQDNPGVEQLRPITRHFVDPRTMSTLPRTTQYRPLLPLTLSLNHALFGHNLVAYHLTNLGLLLICGLLGYRLLRRLLEIGGVEAPRQLAFGAALIFALHPVAGVPVNYVCARDLLLMQLFLLASLLIYVELRQAQTRAWPRRTRAALWALSLLCLALSLLSKTNAVMAPLLVILFELTVFGERARSRRPWLRALPFALVVLGFFLLTERVLGFSDLENARSVDVSAWTYGLTQGRLHLVHYLRNAFFPFGMNPDPHVLPARGLLEPGVIAGAALIAGSLALALWQWRRRPLLACAILAYWIALAPTSSIVPLHHLAVDYRPLPGALFFWLALGLGLRKLRLTPALRACLVAAFVLYLGLTSHWLNRTWRSEQTLWRHAVAQGGGALAHLNLALSLPDARERVPLLERALELSPGHVLAELNLGRTLVYLGQVEGGLQRVEAARSRRPDWAQVHYWAAKTYAELGRREQAAAGFVEAARLDPKNIDYQYEAALWLQLTGDIRGSLPILRELDERHRDVGFLLGWALQSMGSIDEAIAVYSSFLERHPDHEQARRNLAFAKGVRSPSPR